MSRIFCHRAERDQYIYVHICTHTLTLTHTRVACVLWDESIETISHLVSLCFWLDCFGCCTRSPGSILNEKQNTVIIIFIKLYRTTAHICPHCSPNHNPFPLSYSTTNPGSQNSTTSLRQKKCYKRFNEKYMHIKSQNRARSAQHATHTQALWAYDCIYAMTG